MSPPGVGTRTLILLANSASAAGALGCYGFPGRRS
jgi:hypothetical protein